MAISLNSAEVISFLGDGNFAVSLENSWYRRLLHPTVPISLDQKRTGRFFDACPSQFGRVFLSLAEWLSKDTHRVLWIDHFDSGFPSQVTAFLRILGDLVEEQCLIDTPGIMLGPFPVDLSDLELEPTSARGEAEKLVSLCTLLTVGNWDAKLLARDSTDYIEFWEGNIFLYSSDRQKLDNAIQILDFYGLRNEVR